MYIQVYIHSFIPTHACTRSRTHTHTHTGMIVFPLISQSVEIYCFTFPHPPVTPVWDSQRSYSFQPSEQGVGWSAALDSLAALRREFEKEREQSIMHFWLYGKSPPPPQHLNKMITDDWRYTVYKRERDTWVVFPLALITVTVTAYCIYISGI